MKVYAKAPGLQPPVAAPKPSASLLSRARVTGSHDKVVSDDHDEHMRRAITERALRPMQAKTGYEDLLAAARTSLGLDLGLTMQPAQMKAAGNTVYGEPPAALSRESEPGGMPPPVRAKMERAFGTDFSDVRVHPGSARAVELGALAFTQGREVHVAPGHWAPETKRGQALLGHELAHVLQQRAGRVQATAQLEGVGLNDDPALEAEADAMGARAARGHDERSSAIFGAVATTSALGPRACIQRQEAKPQEAKPKADPWEGLLPPVGLIFHIDRAMQLIELYGDQEEALAAAIRQDVKAVMVAREYGVPGIVKLVETRGKDGSFDAAKARAELTASCGASDKLTLADDLRGMLNAKGRPRHDCVMLRIQKAPVSERRAVLNDSTLMKSIRSHFTGGRGTTVMTSLMEGSQSWENPPKTDFYKFFVTGTGSLSSSSTMNCWEGIMYAAYLAGAVEASWIEDYYLNAGAGPGATNDSKKTTAELYKSLGFSTELPTYNPQAKPPRIPNIGQLVFYLRKGKSIPSHVALYKGNGEVLSLWNEPGGIKQVQRIPITTFSDTTIYYGNPPW